MPRILIIALFVALATGTYGQNVGVGTTFPSEKLHVRNGNLRVDDGASMHISTYPTDTAGIYFLYNKIFKGGFLFNSDQNQLNLTRNDTLHGLTYNLNNGKVFIGRDFGLTGNETFGVSTPGNTWGGMYMETYGGPNGRPFYGYGIDSTARAYHYYDGASAQWRLVTGSVPRITVDSATGNIEMDGSTLFTDALLNRVGIGTSTPEDKLHINGALRIDDVTSRLSFYSGPSFKSFIQNSGNIFTISNKAPGNINLMTADIARLSITNAGNVGIGTVSPAAKLHVEGNLRLNNTTPQLGLYSGGVFKGFIQTSNEVLTVSNKGSASLNLMTNDAVRVSINNSGEVGLGTTTPQSRLHVIGVARIDATNPTLNFFNGAAGKGSVQAVGNDMRITNTAGGIISLVTNNTPRLSVIGGGNVGVGTTTPESDLHIVGNARIEAPTAQLGLYNGAVMKGFIQAGNEILTVSNKGSDNINFMTNDFIRMSIAHTTGNVGIGTDFPNAKLHVNGGAGIRIIR